ncbi:non-ribosomal peptide synthetase [Micromonospora siamensis]|uniref:Amino acid adenylation domain-containing protein n=1 Tax=Micromonospora siamensis TaxID=299152 RepID=A0A1C5I9G0_9ACTN|nr:non-ribosomal peptide synthetase [Micromonospora siamensis]SCG54763.1 amino acid adenylation domain-containing protein [Micromonospora siamensis]
MELTEEKFVVPTSYSQRRLWFLEQMEGGGPAWNIQAVLRLRGALDPELLHEAVNAVVRRHEALRTTFAAADGDPVQVVWPWSGIELERVACDDRDDPAGTADEWLSGAWQRPFDIEAGPLFRAALLRLGEEEHRLALGLHHLIADGWSLQLLYREVVENYRRLRAGAEPRGDDLPIQYADFAAWERENVTPETLGPSMEVWRQRLKGAGDPTGLPTDRPRTADTAAQGRLLLATLPGDLIEDVRSFAAGRGATVFMVLLAAFDTLLHRYSGQTDVLVGVPMAGRGQPGLGELIGCFVNTVVARTDLAGDPTFDRLLGQVREVSLEAVGHQEVPLEWLVKELRPDRDGDRQTFFQTVLHLAEVSLNSIHLDGLTVDVVRMDTQAPGVDLALTLVPTDSGLAAAWEYDAALFDAGSIERLHAHLRTLLEAAVADPGLRLSELPMLGAAEREALLAPGPAADPEPPLLPELVAGWARERPDVTAVTDGDRSLSWAQLDTRADRLAAALRAHGVGPEARVGVCLPRTTEWITALLAVLKAGGAYLPLDPEYPAARLEYMLTDSAASVLIGSGPAVEELSRASGVPLLSPDACADATDTGPGPHRDDLAYVIYTSGSTGRPKGVQITHASYAALLAAQRARLPHGPDDTVLQFCSPSFDASMFEIGLAVGAGARLALGTRDELVPGEPLAALMRRHRVTSWTAPPSAIAALGAADVPSLRVVIGAGEVLTAGAVRHWTPQARCFNLYGPTEATIWATGHEVRESDVDGALPIGTAIPGYSALVLDEDLRPVPVNVVGELYVGGVGTARGYLGRPGLTAERFLPDPYSARPGARLYRTGDLARRRSDGELVFAGRADDQIKVRGFRVEPGEIESALAAHPGVRECAIVARADSLGVVGLTACVVRAPDGPPVSTEQLRDHLTGRLPAHFWPAGYVFLESLPITGNGKADRAALAALIDEAGERVQPESVDYEPPRTPLEEILVDIWQEVLDVPRIGVHDSFFDKGGHSLLAAQVIARVKAATGLDVSVRLLFEHRVLADLAEAIMQLALGEEQREAAR